MLGVRCGQRRPGHRVRRGVWRRSAGFFYTGFIASCNRGATEASGEILIFLNNDTLPMPGWLPSLLRVLHDNPDAGAVGGKLVYPDGTLQEAGGVIFSDGSGCNFGKHDPSANAPLYSFLREVDYCSAALLATRRALFLELGGFDRRFQPAITKTRIIASVCGPKIIAFITNPRVLSFTSKAGHRAQTLRPA
jgi:hypothetical protein